MIFLRQSTIASGVFGPFLDETDGYTPETALTIAQSDVYISKNGQSFEQKNDAGGGAHDSAGWYLVYLDTTDTDTTGSLIAQIDVSGALPVWREFTVVPSMIYDSFIAGVGDFEVKATGVSPAVVSDIQSGLATEANATSNKNEILSSGVNWVSADVSALATEASATTNKNEILASGANWTTADVSALATEANATANKEEILASGDLYWQTGGAAILTSSGIWNYTERTLTDPDSYKADVSGLATEANATTNKDELLASGVNWVSYSPAEIATNIFGYNIDGKTASGLFQVLLAYAQGNINVTGNLFTYYAQDDATSLWVTEISGSSRIRQ